MPCFLVYYKYTNLKRENKINKNLVVFIYRINFDRKRLINIS